MFWSSPSGSFWFWKSKEEQPPFATHWAPVASLPGPCNPALPFLPSCLSPRSPAWSPPGCSGPCHHAALYIPVLVYELSIPGRHKDSICLDNTTTTFDPLGNHQQHSILWDTATTNILYACMVFPMSHLSSYECPLNPQTPLPDCSIKHSHLSSMCAPPKKKKGDLTRMFGKRCHSVQLQYACL